MKMACEHGCHFGKYIKNNNKKENNNKCVSRLARRESHHTAISNAAGPKIIMTSLTIVPVHHVQ